MKGSLKGASHISGEKENDVWNALPVHWRDVEISLKELKDALKKVPIVDEVEEEDVECSACDGDGEVEYTFEHGGAEYEHYYDCPVCNGSGVGDTKETPTEKKIPDPDCVIQFGPCRLAAEYVSRLVKVMDFEKVETASIVSGMDHAGCPVLFKVAETKVLIMPRVHEESDSVIHKFSMI